MQKSEPPTPTSDQSSTSKKQQRKPDHSTRSCVACHEKKIRCDKNMPCSNCKKCRRECIFPPPGRKPRVLRRPRKAALVARVRYLEDKVNQLSRSESSPQYMTADMENPSDGMEITTSTQEGSYKYAGRVSDPIGTRNQDSQSGQLVTGHGNTQYVNEVFENGWSFHHDKLADGLGIDTRTPEHLGISSAERRPAGRFFSAAHFGEFFKPNKSSFQLVLLVEC